ncbi:hypothetical protein ACEQ8H_004985 [Pleosporales sp. CAS-2024a]
MSQAEDYQQINQQYSVQHVSAAAEDRQTREGSYGSQDAPEAHLDLSTINPGYTRDHMSTTPAADNMIQEGFHFPTQAQAIADRHSPSDGFAHMEHHYEDQSRSVLPVQPPLDWRNYGMHQQWQLPDIMGDAIHPVAEQGYERMHMLSSTNQLSRTTSAPAMTSAAYDFRHAQEPQSFLPSNSDNSHLWLPNEASDGAFAAPYTNNMSDSPFTFRANRTKEQEPTLFESYAESHIVTFFRYIMKEKQKNQPDLVEANFNFYPEIEAAARLNETLDMFDNNRDLLDQVIFGIQFPHLCHSYFE